MFRDDDSIIYSLLYSEPCRPRRRRRRPNVPICLALTETAMLLSLLVARFCYDVTFAAASASCGPSHLRLRRSEFLVPVSPSGNPFDTVSWRRLRRRRRPLLGLRGGDDGEDFAALDSTAPSSLLSLDELVVDFSDNGRKILVVTGGVLSGIGKGVTASSIGVLLRMCGVRVTALKIDPYLNVDAGTMSPFEHGEVFVLDDGGECDLDLGNYERFLSVSLSSKSNLTTGKIYREVIERERVGHYLGKTVQVVPHISDAIQRWVLRVSAAPVLVHTEHSVDGSTPPTSQVPEVCIVELGGTLGDIESMPFVEALRQLQEKVGYKHMAFVHVSLVPVLGSPPEQKTKPTQHSVRTMRQLGLVPDFLCCRGTAEMEDATRSKLSSFTGVPRDAVISLHDVSNIYRVPLMMMEQDVPAMLCKRLRLAPFNNGQKAGNYGTPAEKDEEIMMFKNMDLIKSWNELADSVDDPESECVIAMVGKYLDQGDACKF
uniref:CTP synthase (glutamine hydrolyzing) n=1 Tax=Corethron hystrix TaxID=216773 RepID=A0A7S1FR37_9STRA|mmetsp:Transcript_22068/g.50413  ORF Transcript_22068/g.50413 Transcript_22068/m.50413 type:complete len:487 (+) Transcript_22068:112-1572(+)